MTKLVKNSQVMQDVPLFMMAMFKLIILMHMYIITVGMAVVHMGYTMATMARSTNFSKGISPRAIQASQNFYLSNFQQLLFFLRSLFEYNTKSFL